MPAFDAGVGSATATSYVSVEAAADYFATRYNTAAWDALVQATKEKALMAATSRLEMEAWVGRKASTDQALAWPRLGIYDRDQRYVSTSVIPLEVKRATCELALHLLNNATTDLMAPDALQQFDAVSVGPLDVTPNPDAVPSWMLPAAVLRWLACYLRSSGAQQTRLVRG